MDGGAQHPGSGRLRCGSSPSGRTAQLPGEGVDNTVKKIIITVGLLCTSLDVESFMCAILFNTSWDPMS